MRNLLALTFVIVFSALLIGFNQDDKKVGSEATKVHVFAVEDIDHSSLNNKGDDEKGGESVNNFRNLVNADPFPAVESGPMIVRWSDLVSGESGGVRCENMKEAWDRMHILASWNLNDARQPYSIWVEKAKTNLRSRHCGIDSSVSDSRQTRGVERDLLLRNLYSHIHRVYDVGRQAVFLANYSDVSNEEDSRIIELDQGISTLDEERRVLLRLLHAEFAGFNERYDMAIHSTIVPAWKHLAMNVAGLARAMAWRGYLDDSMISDFSTAETDAELTIAILSVGDELMEFERANVDSSPRTWHW
ncbi:MAG: hypothetical protein HZA94_02255 [Candidatus Vogelbacteria bacterium]|nr:hypothetical protein [Candidatus Vogelbacteria bacterium]